MSKILEKVKAHRTRQAEIEGEPCLVRVYSGAELKRLIDQIRSGEDKTGAVVLSEQFLDMDEKKIFDPDWFLSDECTQVFIAELAQLFVEINTGTAKKKMNHQNV